MKIIYEVIYKRGTISNDITGNGETKHLFTDPLAAIQEYAKRSSDSTLSMLELNQIIVTEKCSHLIRLLKKGDYVPLNIN